MDKRGVLVATVSYTPNVKDTTDLEAGTTTITATSQGGTADYSQALTLPVPSNGRIIIKRIAARLQVTRDSGTSSNLYCSVYVDNAAGDDTDKRLFNAVDVQAANLQVVAVTSGDVFDFLSDGAAHTFYFFFWTDAGDSVISLVQLWEAVGVAGAGEATVIQIDHVGFLSTGLYFGRIGSGAASGRLRYIAGTYNIISVTKTDADFEMTLADGLTDVTTKGTVATDINYIVRMGVLIRCEP